MDARIPADAGRVGSGYRQWKLPVGKLPWELGQKTNWPLLESFLDSSGADDFHVTDEALERCLAEVQGLFNASRDSAEKGVVYQFVGKSGGDNAGLLKRLLALGIEPDLRGSSKGFRPSHLCGEWACVGSAAAICRCRPNLTAKSDRGKTPRDVAATSFNDHDMPPPFPPESELRKRRPLVRKIWEEAENNGFPSVAKMAADKEWWALKNVCRRRIFTETEALALHSGKDAIGWAEAHGEQAMAAELRYYFRHPMTKKAVDQVTVEINDLKKSVVDLIGQDKSPSDMVPDVSVIKEHVSQLAIRVTDLESKLDERVQSFTEEIGSIRAVMTSTRTSTVGGSASSPSGAGRHRAQQDSGDALSGGAGRPHAFVSDLVRQVEALAMDPLQSLEFFFDLNQLLGKYGKPPQS